jgi:hypothetical protein
MCIRDRSWDIIRKMVEEESKYDADIITYLKYEMRKCDEKWKQWELENEGKVWWHNSKINKFSIECPGEGWVLGMIFRAQNDCWISTGRTLPELAQGLPKAPCDAL